MWIIQKMLQIVVNQLSTELRVEKPGSVAYYVSA